MREFNKNGRSLSEIPNIIWDDSFVPPELYDDLDTEMGSLDTKEGQHIYSSWPYGPKELLPHWNWQWFRIYGHSSD